MLSSLTKIPTVPVALCVAAGILSYVYLSGPVLAVALILWLAAALLLWNRGLRFVPVSMAAFPLGIALAALSAPLTCPVYLQDGNERTYTGRVADVSAGTSSVRALIDVTSHGSVFRTNIVTGIDAVDFSEGDEIEFRTRLDPVPDPGELPGLRSAYTQSLSGKYSAVAFVPAGEIRLVQSCGGFRGFVNELRDDVRDRILLSGLSPRVAFFLAATVVGDSSGFSADDRESFRNTGLSHLLCVSGLHTGIIAALVSLALFPLKHWQRVGRLRHLVTIAVIWLYAMMVGFTPSVVRAAVMLSLVLIGHVTQRGAYSFNSLALAAIVILLIEPYSLFSVGFLLSFSAVAGLLLFSRKLNPVPERNFRLHNLVALVIAPVAAMAGMLPVILAVFGRIPPLFLPVNALVAVVFPIFMCLGLGCTLLSAFGLHLTPLVWAVDKMGEFIFGISQFASDLSGSAGDVSLTTLGAVALAGVILCVAAALRLSTARHRRIALVCSLSCVLLMACAETARRPEPKAAMYVVSTTGRTDILVRDGKRLYVVNAHSSPRDSSTFNQECRKSYGDFMNHADIDSLIPVVGNLRHGQFRRSAGRVYFRGTEILVLNGTSSDSIDIAFGAEVGAVLVSRGYRGNLSAVLEANPGGIILLDARASQSLRSKCLEETTRTHRPFIDLRFKSTVRVQ